ncbi:MAG: methionine adenosyltransferase domain-containing protein, partial [Paludibacteraceae bacterium]|nr:methionine adenosyltransferase domain-containing protein [Paludibacteraceae bacterium]
IDTIVVSTQHDPDVSQEQIRRDIREILLPRVATRDSRYAALLEADDYRLLVNPTGNFVIGGPHGDTGLTGRKIIVDTYGGRGAHGGGAFSGKDPSKVDRSAAYAARWIAKNLVAAGVAREVLVQLSYAIGVAEPVSVYVNTYSSSRVKLTDNQIAAKVSELFDLRPGAIEEALQLRQPIYEETASYGHMGRTPQVVEKQFTDGNGNKFSRKVELFTWEKLDRVEDIRKAFGIGN